MPNPISPLYFAVRYIRTLVTYIHYIWYLQLLMCDTVRHGVIQNICRNSNGYGERRSVSHSLDWHSVAAHAQEHERVRCYQTEDLQMFQKLWSTYSHITTSSLHTQRTSPIKIKQQQQWMLISAASYSQIKMREPPLHLRLYGLINSPATA